MAERTRTRSDSGSLITPTKLWNSETIYFNRDPEPTPPIKETTTDRSDFYAAASEDSMTDVVTPGFEARKAKGDVIMSPMHSGSNSFIDSVGVLEATWWNDIEDGEDSRRQISYRKETMSSAELMGITDASFPTPPVENLGSMRSLAIADAHKNISCSEMQLWATLGEGKKTVNSVYSITKRVVKIYRAIRKLDYKFLKRQISRKELEDRYMEARYALRPLYMDVRNAVKATQASRPKRSRQTFRGRASDQWSETSETMNPIYPQVWATIKVRSLLSTSVSYEVSAGVLTDIEYMGLSHNFGLAEVPASIWELVPFSFIIDWFFNVGTLISAWQPKPGFTVLGSWVTTKVTTTRTAIVTSTDSYTDQTYIGATTSGNYTSTSVSISREPNPSRPVLPSYDVNLDWAKLLDLGIILKRL